MLLRFCLSSGKFGSDVWSKVCSSHKEVCSRDKRQVNTSLEEFGSGKDVRYFSVRQWYCPDLLIGQGYCLDVKEIPPVV